MRLFARLAAVLSLTGAALVGTAPITGAAGTATPPTPAARPAAPLAAHRALYQLTLEAARGGHITSAHGTMGYEVTDVCDGWATRQRLRMTTVSSEGQQNDTDSDYVTWESKDGLNFRFHMVQKSDGSVTSQTDGSARLTRAGGTGEARYRMPREETKELPAGTLFPMMHTVAILNAAREGKRFLGLPLFDGTDEKGVEDSSIAILDWKPPFDTKQPMLTPLPNTRVRLAFFDRAADTVTPSYEVAMRYWENGVADNMLMDFRDFVMNAKLTELAPIPRRC